MTDIALVGAGALVVAPALSCARPCQQPRHDASIEAWLSFLLHPLNLDEFTTRQVLNHQQYVWYRVAPDYFSDLADGALTDEAQIVEFVSGCVGLDSAEASRLQVPYDVTFLSDGQTVVAHTPSSS